MAFFSKETIIKLKLPIFHGEGRANISRGFNFSQVEGAQLHISI